MIWNKNIGFWKKFSKLLIKIHYVSKSIKREKRALKQNKKLKICFGK